MIFSIGFILFILSRIGTFFTHDYLMDWRDYLAGSLVVLGSGLMAYSVLNFLSRHLV